MHIHDNGITQQRHSNDSENSQEKKMELLFITRYYGGNCRVDIVVCRHEVSHR